MAEIISCIADKAVQYLVDSTLSQLKYLFCFGTNVQNLSNAIEDLRIKRDTLQLKINAARSDEITGPDVLNWLKKIDETDEQVKDTLEKISKVKFVNIKSRYILSKKATKIYEEILGLCQKGNFETVVYPAPQVQVPYAASRDFGGFESRMFTREQVMEALRDSSTSVIGICGMAGVGKTVMAKEIADLLKKENVFNRVAFAVVSRNQESEKKESKDQLIIKIQDQLADELKFSISEKNSLHARIQSVGTALQKAKDQKVLIILDDLWEDLDLQEIGIPKLDLCKGLKVLLTSRFSDVCKKTGAQEIFEVKVLTEEEAWHLFKETAGISDDATDLVGIAKEVAKQCARLPLAIVIVAKALENKKIESAWSDALKQLKDGWVTNIRGVHDFVYSRIEWSYKYLENKEAKSVLLLCSLFPEDFQIPIEVLVMYVKGLKLFRRTDTMKQTRDRMESVILDLKDCYLLLNGEDENFVKMHDVVRDVCLIISSNEQLGYMVSNYGTMEGPENHDNRPYTLVSLTIGQLDQLPSNLDYSCLELLRMSYETGEEVLDLPLDILQRVNSLKVLYLKKVNIRSPLPLQPLMSICSLFLHDCKLDRNVFTVSGLDNLQILSFLGSDLLEFPKGIENLGNLKSLNLMFKTCPDPLPIGVLPGLKKLEELYLENYFKRRNGGDAHAFDEQHAEEINSLSQLNVLVVLGMESTIPEEKVLKMLHLADMTRFYIGIQSSKGIFQFPRKFQKIVKVSDIDGEVLGDPNVRRILRKTECLGLERAKGLRNVVPKLEEDGFVNLRELELIGGDHIEIIDATDLVSANIFHNLEVLILSNLNNLIEISNGKMAAGSFRRLQRVELNQLPKMKYLWRHSVQPPSLCNLTVLEVWKCPEIRYLFSQSILKCLAQLQEIEISFCENLEEIVCKEETSTSTSGGPEILVLPKLQSLRIMHTKFRRFWNDDSSTDSSTATKGNLQAMLNRVSLPSMTSLAVWGTINNDQEYVIGSEMQIGSLHQLRSIDVWECSNLKSFFVPLMASHDDQHYNHHHLAAQLLPSLEEITIVRCESIQVLLDFEGMMKFTNNIGGHAADSSSSSKPKPVLLLFDGLREITLNYLPGLKQIWRMPRSSCTTTTTSIYVIKAFQNLKTLSVLNCGSLRHLLSVSMAQMLVSLEELGIGHCNKMEEVIAAEAEEGRQGGDDDITTNIELFLILPSLHQLRITSCQILTKFCVGSKLSAPKLKQVKLCDQVIPEDLKDREVIFVDYYGRKVEDPSTSRDENMHGFEDPSTSRDENMHGFEDPSTSRDENMHGFEDPSTSRDENMHGFEDTSTSSDESLMFMNE